MKARFVSADGLSLDTDILYPPMPRIARWMRSAFDSSLLDCKEVPLERVTLSRNYELVGNRDGVWIYEEIVK